MDCSGVDHDRKDISLHAFITTYFPRKQAELTPRESHMIDEPLDLPKVNFSMSAGTLSTVDQVIEIMGRHDRRLKPFSLSIKWG